MGRGGRQERWSGLTATDRYVAGRAGDGGECRRRRHVVPGAHHHPLPSAGPRFSADCVTRLLPSRLSIPPCVPPSQWGVENLRERVLERRPDVLFIEFAMNDAYLDYSTSTETCRTNLEYMIDRVVQSCPMCSFVLQTMNVCVNNPGTPPAPPPPRPPIGVRGTQ